MELLNQSLVHVLQQKNVNVLLQNGYDLSTFRVCYGSVTRLQSKFKHAKKTELKIKQTFTRLHY